LLLCLSWVDKEGSKEANLVNRRFSPTSRVVTPLGTGKEKINFGQDGEGTEGKGREGKEEYVSGIGAFKPGIFNDGYEGGGPKRCMLISQGGGAPGGMFRAIYPR